MRAKSDDSRTQQPPEPKPAAELLLGTLADTTWRMFVPTIGLTVGGLQLDRFVGTSPWFLIIGIIAGIALSYQLVRRQLRNVEDNDKKQGE